MALSVCTQVGELRARLARFRAERQRIALVPTMGALHTGHLALVQRARELADVVVVSVFVNPTQFGPNEDFARYPRKLDADLAQLEEYTDAATLLVFAPSSEEMYPPGDATRVAVGGVSETLCGPWRPDHFTGVATVVTKLFAIVGECTAVFGRKDYQQLQVVRKMARDLWLPVQVVGVPTVRDADGLALSSRNAYLGAPERARARCIPAALSLVHAAFSAGERRAGRLRELLHTSLGELDSIDYAELADADSLELLSDANVLEDRTVVAIAGRLGTTRLIDNVVLGEDPAPVPTQGSV